MISTFGILRLYLNSVQLKFFIKESSPIRIMLFLLIAFQHESQNINHKYIYISDIGIHFNNTLS